MKQLTIITMCIIALSFCVVGCGEKEEENETTKIMVQPPAEEEEKENILEKIKKENEGKTDLEIAIDNVRKSDYYTEKQKKELMKKLKDEEEEINKIFKDIGEK